eukprot:542726_1
MWSLKMILAPLWLFATTYASGTWEVTRPIGDNINGNPSDVSGFSVSSNSDATIVAIGEPEYAFGNTGRVRVLAWDTDSWQQISEDEEMIGDWGSYSGRSVALSTDGPWSQRGADIDGEASYDESGKSVALSYDGNVVAIGAPHNEAGGYIFAGQTRVFTRTTDGAWSRRGADIDGEASYDESGKSVALSYDGNVVAIGAPYNDAGGDDAGHTRIYEYVEGAWNQSGQDIDGEGAGEQSGWSVALNSIGNVVAIKARNIGSVRIYEYNPDEQHWQKIGDINGTGAPGYFAEAERSVALSSTGDVVAIGSPDFGDRIGQVRIYEYVSKSWKQRGGDIDGTQSDGQLGWSVSLSSDGNTVAVGSYRTNRVGVYRYDGCDWPQRGDDIEGGGGFGYSVSLSSDGNAVVAGARWAGYVAVYDYVGDDCEYELDPIGKSTQFRITNTCDDSFIKVKMETLTELHANLKKTKNKLTSFASTNWIRSSEDDQTQCDCFGYGGACLYNEFTAYLSDDLDTPDDKEPTFVLKTMFALDVLKVTDTIEVPEGGLKLNVEIGDWPFLQEDDDHYLELCMRIMTNDENTFTLTNNGESYTITSEHISMQNLLSADCGTDKDSVTVNVDPTPNEDGNQLLICYTFDSECDSIVYDPIYSFTHADTESEQSAAANEDTNPTNPNNDTIDGVSVAVLISVICVFAFIAAAAAVFCYHQVKRKNEEMISIAAATEPMEEEVIDEDVFGDGNDDETVTVNTKGPTDTIPV